MGIDYHGLRFLQYVSAKGPLGATATLGHQNIFVSDHVLRAALPRTAARHYGPFCEELLLENFGATRVTSFDASDYEKASILHDFNKPIQHGHLYDTVIDFGTLEHIFNIPVAFANIAAICRPGGRIIHALPANNFSGHGFWQLSPELFFSLYSRSNGFDETEVFIAELDDERSWWKANVPANGTRVEYTSASRSSVLVVTRKRAPKTSQLVQQSDYIVNWESGQPPIGGVPQSTRLRLNSTLKRLPVMWRLADAIFPVPNSHTDARLHRLSGRNPHFTKMPIATLISEGDTGVAGA